MTRNAAAALAAALLLDACSGEHGGTPASEGSEASGAGEVVTATTAPAALPDAIPEAMRGRWGIVPADCTGPASEAKGLMRVGPHELEFYESRGALGTVTSGDATRIRAAFAFIGEGMRWSREQRLELREDGRTLVRQEFGPGSIPGPLTYHRCH